MSGEIRYEIVGNVGVLTLNRPDALNALRRDMVSELRETLIDIEQTGGVRALVLTGEGRAFCAGVDLNEAEDDVSGDDLGEVEDGLESIQDITRLLMELPIPTIAALNGLAVGMGSEMCIACDIRIAARSAFLWFSEAKRSLFQSNGVMYLLPRLIGHSRSIEWMMSARRIQSDELHASGLVAQLFDDDGFHAAALAYAQAVARNSPLSLRLLKEVGRASFEASYEEVMHLEVEGMKETMRSEYVKEGLRAFAEKREPNF
jgi:enoyl-CoA hydratase/carnithine racemase